MLVLVVLVNSVSSSVIMLLNVFSWNNCIVSVKCRFIEVGLVVMV